MEKPVLSCGSPFLILACHRVSTCMCSYDVVRPTSGLMWMCGVNESSMIWSGLHWVQCGYVGSMSHRCDTNNFVFSFTLFSLLLLLLHCNCSMCLGLTLASIK